jgi:hypothetical protein
VETIEEMADAILLNRKKIEVKQIPSEYKMGVIANEYKAHTYDFYVVLPLSEMEAF